MKEIIKKYLFKHPRLYQTCAYIYTILAHKERLMRLESFGEKNRCKTVMIIRPNAEDGIQGLLSLVAETLRWIDYADQNKFIPVVDYKNFNSQYSNHVDNAWEFFFEQPTSLTLEEAYQSERVLFSGVTKKPVIDLKLFSGEIFQNSSLLEESKRIAQTWIHYTDEVNSVVDEENSQIHIEDCIGVYIRGTDYISLKPTGEYVQPSIGQVIKKIKEFSLKHGEKAIFLVTEDDIYYQAMTKEFGNRVKIVSYDSFIKNFHDKVYLSESNSLDKDLKNRGMKYLVKIVLLSRCRYLVSSIAKGSIMAYSLNENGYEDEYIFDLGVYK